MILLVFGTHLSVQKALRALGRNTDFFVVSDLHGLNEYAMKRYSEGKALVLSLDGSSWQLKRARKIVDEAKAKGIDLVLETLYWKGFHEFVNDVDVLYVNGRFFRPEVIP